MAHRRGRNSRDAALLPFGRKAVLLLGASPQAVAAVRALVAPALAPDAAVTVLPIADKWYSVDSTYSLCVMDIAPRLRVLTCA